ncbi:MAG: hypothetical protein ACHQET_03960 [Chitinophagales bacterium]
MARITTFILTLVCCSLSATSQNSEFKPSFRVIVSKTPTRFRQCSRTVPEKIKSFWVPTQSDIEVLESNLNSIYDLRANTGGVIGAKVDSLDKFAFQYIGVIIKGEKYIYINAFPIGLTERYKKANFDLTQSLVIVCDGGVSFWGVLFNLNTKQFTLLSFNGYA